MRKVFTSLDKDGNGTISKDELFKVYQEIHGPEFAPSDIEAIIKQVDSDDNGLIDYSEWIKATYNHWYFLSNKKLEEAFKLFDTDGNSMVSL